MVSVDRVKEYVQLPAEGANIIEPRPPVKWPLNGAIQVNDLSIRYASDLPKVLEGINFSAKPGEKVGIVGATGSGKSTLALAFLRFTGFDDGKIVIDGVDISQIGLYDLRSRLTIIPQDPVSYDRLTYFARIRILPVGNSCRHPSQHSRPARRGTQRP